MNYIKNQKGVGLVEVLVALVILTVGVLGFTALQLRALNATSEAADRSNAINLARDLADRIRVNRQALASYITAINSKTQETGCIGSTANYVPNCTPAKMANYDAKEIVDKASDNGQTIVMANCIGSKLNCIYVAWATTEISSTDLTKCVNSSTGTYIPDSKCLVMEAF